MGKRAKKRRRRAKAKSTTATKRLRLLLIALVAVVLTLAFARPWAQSEPVDYSFEIVNRYPHDADAFTQGLIFHRGYLYESTGLNGASSLRMVDLGSGNVIKRHNLAPRYFGEGLTEFGGVLVLLTWKSGTAQVFHGETFELLREYSYETEGWGLTHDGTHFIMSDGSDRLYFRDPQDFKLVRTMVVKDKGKPLSKLNELEFIEGEIWANVWSTNKIVRISPRTGAVLGRVHLDGLLRRADRNGREDTLNGIAYDAEKDRLFVTGKRYSHVYEITIHPQKKRQGRRG